MPTDVPSPTLDGLLHYEDVALNDVKVYGPLVVTKEDIVEFATKFDPQPIHLDEEAAKRSIVGGLCASGVHTCSIMMRLLCDHWLNHTASLGAPGLEEMKWLRPVRPGDALSIRIHFDAKRTLASRPDVGMARAVYDMVNQRGETVLSSVCQQLIRVRHPVAAERAGQMAAPRERAKIRSLWDEDAGPQPTGGTYFEDHTIGRIVDLGSHAFEAGEIMDFARRFDPQPFHLSEEAGRKSLFGGLAASGWHTYAHYIRAIVLERQRHQAAAKAAGLPAAVYGPSPGFKDLKWPKPVMSGDTISYRIKTIDKVEMKSRPDRGIVVSQGQGRNQKGEIVFDYQGMIIVEKKR